jgi:hypothetical protein
VPSASPKIISVGMTLDFASRKFSNPSFVVVGLTFVRKTLLSYFGTGFGV